MTAYRVLRMADPDGAKRISKAIAMLAVDSHPAESNALGGTSFRRLRLDRYRVLYEVTEDMIRVMHVGRVIER
jgi:mRNA-degrading endonuclease RelE of RelBE toxin-antitoxin system